MEIHRNAAYSAFTSKRSGHPKKGHETHLTACEVESCGERGGKSAAKKGFPYVCPYVCVHTGCGRTRGNSAKAGTKVFLC